MPLVEDLTVTHTLPRAAGTSTNTHRSIRFRVYSA
jgi:hypothetical protein